MAVAAAKVAAGTSGSRFLVLRPGRLRYGDGLALQEILLERRRQIEEDLLLLLEHEPVVTLGRRAKAASHLLLSRQELAAQGIEVAAAARGGDVTYHGPGQLVGYPIVDLTPRGRDLHRYLRQIEEVLRETLAAFGVDGERSPGRTGLWVDGRKIASIGVGVRRWIAWHGFALNVADDLRGFDAIVPCGLPGVEMISLETLLGRRPAPAEVEEQVATAFARVFDAEPVRLDDLFPAP